MRSPARISAAVPRREDRTSPGAQQTSPADRSAGGLAGHEPRWKRSGQRPRSASRWIGVAGAFGPDGGGSAGRDSSASAAWIGAGAQTRDSSSRGNQSMSSSRGGGGGGSSVSRGGGGGGGGGSGGWWWRWEPRWWRWRRPQVTYLEPLTHFRREEKAMVLYINRKKRDSWFKRCGALLMAAAFIALLISGPSQAETVKQRTFASPEEAVKAMVEALKSNDVKAVEAIFGPGSRDLLSSGDPVADTIRARAICQTV